MTVRQLSRELLRIIHNDKNCPEKVLYPGNNNNGHELDKHMKYIDFINEKLEEIMYTYLIEYSDIEIQQILTDSEINILEEVSIYFEQNKILPDYNSIISQAISNHIFNIML